MSWDLPHTLPKGKYLVKLIGGAKDGEEYKTNKPEEVIKVDHIEPYSYVEYELYEARIAARVLFYRPVTWKAKEEKK